MKHLSAHRLMTAGITIPVALALLWFMAQAVGNTAARSSDFMPHGFCYLWNPRIVWLHVISDGLLTLSYYCIPLLFIVSIRRELVLPFTRVFWMFVGFILSCGTIHLIEIWNIWHSDYVLSGAVKAFTALISAATVVMLIPLVPEIIALPSRLQLQKLNGQLHEEMAERKRAEARNLRLAAIVDSSDNAILSKDLSGTITSWNKGAEGLYGYSEDEIVGQNVRLIVPGNGYADEDCILAKIAEGHQVTRYETTRKRKDGSEVQVSLSVSPLRDESGRIVGASSIAHDITERVAAEQALREQKYAFDQHADLSTTDVDGRITYANDRFCSISKYSREELMGQNHRIVNSGLHPKEFFRQLWDTIGRGEVWHGEIRNRAKDGALYWSHTTIVPFLYADGTPRQYMAIRANITERKLAEERLAGKIRELARSNAELEQFAYVASHDLQEPLRMVANYTQLLAERYRGKLDEQADKYIHYAIDGATRMQAMIQDLLTYSRAGRQGNNIHNIDVNTAVQAALENLEPVIRESGAAVKYDRLPTVEANAIQITQLFQNLIGNAIKFRGKLPPVVQIAAEQNGDEWVFSVADNGIGIAAEHSQIIFAIFQRLHTRNEYSGNGIGLAICKKIVERHGGRIWVESKEGQGATFKFTLPAAEATTRNASAAG